MASEKEVKVRITYNKNVKPRLDEITDLRKQGYNYDMISKTLGIARRTLYEYTQKYEELREALTRGKKEYEIDLRHSLYARAKGFMVTEKTTRNYYNADGDLVKTEKVEKERYIYSDFMAAKLLKLETVLDNDDMPLELQEIMKITQQNIDDEYADE
ncbi:MAG: hypothetical protein ACRCYT_09545 [Cetobacterium sp.]